MRWLSWILLSLVAVGLGAVTWAPVRRFSGAVHVLLDLSAPPSASTHAVAEDLLIPGDGPVRARLYEPQGAVHRCIVVGHGVHHLGIAEPRLVRFSTELASTGAMVLTPELADLADYRITRNGADVLGRATHYLAERCPGMHKVGLIGFSFAGGLSLLSATDPAVSRDLEYVTSVGGYHDLARVLRFLLTDTVETPDGPKHRAAHEYGNVVLVYGYIDQLVPKADVEIASRAVRAWLEEHRDQAWKMASQRTTRETEELFVRLSNGHISDMRRTLGAILEQHAAELTALSPRGHLHEIPVPVYLLHGTGDSVIPPEETLWADRELGAQSHVALVTPLIEHVAMAGKPQISDQLALSVFMARLL